MSQWGLLIGLFTSWFMHPKDILHTWRTKVQYNEAYAPISICFAKNPEMNCKKNFKWRQTYHLSLKEQYFTTFQREFQIFIFKRQIAVHDWLIWHWLIWISGRAGSTPSPRKIFFSISCSNFWKSSQNCMLVSSLPFGGKSWIRTYVYQHLKIVKT